MNKEQILWRIPAIILMLAWIPISIKEFNNYGMTILGLMILSLPLLLIHCLEYGVKIKDLRTGKYNSIIDYMDNS